MGSVSDESWYASMGPPAAISQTIGRRWLSCGPTCGRSSLVSPEWRAAVGVSRMALEVMRNCGFDAGLNDPFAGGHVIERHGWPARGVHALQLEIDRRCYLDDVLREPGPGFDRTAGFIETLVVALGEALLGRQYATAAE